MSNMPLQEHLRKCAEMSKTYTNEKLVEFNEAVVGAIEEIVSALQPALDFFNASGLYIDNDGDIAQKEEDDETNG